jgi:hypothetical protein
MYTIEDLKKYAKNKNGLCLSQEYKTNDTKYLWECKNKHQFEKVWYCVKTRDEWCNICRLGHYIEYLQEYAIKFNGECLSETFTDSKTKYNFKCENKHTFDLTYSQIKKDIWCKFCKNNRTQYTIENLKEYAINKGGICLSDEYFGISKNYTWTCENNHNFESNWQNMVSSGAWCLKCNLWNFEDFKEIAEKNGGECLRVIEGIGLRGKYEFRCEENHTWITNGGSIACKKTWCPECQKLTIEDCHKEALLLEGKCLETLYINRRTKMEWECKNKHIFKLTLGAVRNNKRWCRLCFVNSISHDIDVAHKLASQYEGKCLSTVYVNLETPMKWECKNGHTWEVAMSHIKNGNTWCRKCHLQKRRDKSIENIFNWVHKLGGEVITKKEDIPYECRSDSFNLTILCNKNIHLLIVLKIFSVVLGVIIVHINQNLLVVIYLKIFIHINL